MAHLGVINMRNQSSKRRNWTSAGDFMATGEFKVQRGGDGRAEAEHQKMKPWLLKTEESLAGAFCAEVFESGRMRVFESGAVRVCRRPSWRLSFQSKGPRCWSSGRGSPRSCRVLEPDAGK